MTTATPRSASARTNALFSEELDRDDPWQFLNFRVR
jgi:homospermidine synthase